MSGEAGAPGEIGSKPGRGRAAVRPVARLRSWWGSATFGTRNPGRRVAALAALGVLEGLAEASLVVILVAIAAGSTGREELPIVGELPADTWVMAAIALAILAALTLSHVAAARITTSAAAGAQRVLQEMLVTGYLHTPWIRQASVRSGELQDLVMDKAVTLAQGTQEAAATLATMLGVVVLIVGAIAVSAWAALVLLVTLVLATLIGRPLRTQRRRISDIVGSSTGLAVDVAEGTEAVRDLRVFGVLEPARARLAAAIATYSENLRKLQFLAIAGPALTRDLLLALLVVTLAVIVGVGEMSLPVLGVVVLLMLRALTHAQRLSSLAYYLREREANLGLIQGRLEEWAPEHPSGSRPCPPIRRIELGRVSYRYPGSPRPALEDVSIELAGGERLGIAGRSGAGKSTLAAILLGLVAPDSGIVSIDGVPLHELDPDEWHRRTAWIGQEPHLITGTIAENISFLRSGLDREAIERAARAAALGPELEGWAGGLDHHVGPSGVAISGGERQRVALARALAAEPDLLVLDEPTSALDVQTEAAFRETLLGLESAITVVIAHRPSTIEVCDRVAVIDSGRLVTVAPPSELSSAQAYLRDAFDSPPRSD